MTEDILGFQWGNEDWYNRGSVSEPAGRGKLAKFVKNFKSLMESVVDPLCREEVHVYAHSQGTIVAREALRAGAKLGQVVFTGSPIPGKDTGKGWADNATTIYNYWSENDKIAALLKRSLPWGLVGAPSLTNVKNIDFSTQLSLKSGQQEPVGHSDYNTKRLAKGEFAKYFPQTRAKGVCCVETDELLENAVQFYALILSRLDMRVPLQFLSLWHQRLGASKKG